MWFDSGEEVNEQEDGRTVVLASEETLAMIWESPQEDEAWANL